MYTQVYIVCVSVYKFFYFGNKVSLHQVLAITIVFMHDSYRNW